MHYSSSLSSYLLTGSEISQGLIYMSDNTEVGTLAWLDIMEIIVSDYLTI